VQEFALFACKLVQKHIILNKITQEISVHCVPFSSKTWHTPFKTLYVRFAKTKLIFGEKFCENHPAQRGLQPLNKKEKREYMYCFLSLHLDPRWLTKTNPLPAINRKNHVFMMSL
jgi:hypothetical protein